MNLILSRALRLAILLLLLRVLGRIVWEYRYYFPPDFQSAFLTGMEERFHGLYPPAFYLHIICGPIVLLNLLALYVLASFKLPSQSIKQSIELHRKLGRIQGVLVLAVLVPTGIVMAMHAKAGPVAGAGLLTLAIATGWTMIRSIQFARRGRLVSHQEWAVRCAILLLSPLILRLTTGLAMVVNLESGPFHVINAWASWLIPMVLYELYLLRSRLASSKPVPNRSGYQLD